MAMDYMTLIRNGYPSGHYNNMQPFNNNPNGNQGYPYRYTNEQLYMMAQYQQQQRAMMGQGGMPPSKANEPKPRLSKDEVELLEREFDKNSKPSSGRKREIAELLKVDHPRINNWFQNRRAKEKQIKKTREFEAQQAAQRAGSDATSPSDQDSSAVAEYYGSSNHSQPLQASSAAFPSTIDTAQPPCHVQADGSLSTDALHCDDLPGLSASDEDSDSYTPDEYPSPKSLAFQHTDPCDVEFTPMAGAFLPPQVTNNFEPQMVGQSVQHGMPTVEATHDTFHHFTSSMTVDNIIAPVPTFPSQLLGLTSAHHEFKSEDSMAHEQLSDAGLKLEEHSPVPLTQSPLSAADMRFKSPPPPANLANRRNKGVPAQLNPTALRSYSYGPKTGIELGKRPEAPSPMRRIASATGSLPGRIQKSSVGSAPRSPLYLERTKEALMRTLQDARSPILGSINTALSPVTPNEYSASSSRAAREATVSSSASDDEQRYTFGNPQNAFFRLDSTLKTPPSTPGMGKPFADNMLAIDTAWNYVPSDEPLITPSLGSFGSEEFSMAPNAPGYAVHSQPPTPSYAPSSVGPTYFPWGLTSAPTNTEYTFPGDPYTAADTSAKSSPGQSKAKQFQFTQNITPHDFSIEKQ